MSHDSSIETTNDDLVTFVENTVRKDNIDCGSETFDNLDFENSTFESRDVHQTFGHSLLSELDDKHEHVGNTFSSVSRCRDEGDVLCEVLVVVVRDSVETLLGESDDRVLETLLEFSLNCSVLLSESLLESSVFHRLPSVETIDLKVLKASEHGGEKSSRNRSTPC